MFEQFDSKILKFKRKLIITMLEEIRLYIVDKFGKQRKLYDKYIEPLCPKVRGKLDKSKKENGKWIPTQMGDLEELKFQAECKSNKFIVNLKERTCSC